MTTRNVAEINLTVGKRTVTVKAMDAIGPEDYFDVAFRATLHRFITKQDHWTPAPREIKDWMLKTNLNI